MPSIVRMEILNLRDVGLGQIYDDANLPVTRLQRLGRAAMTFRWMRIVEIQVK